jgi:hypothetical protein
MFDSTVELHGGSPPELFCGFTAVVGGLNRAIESDSERQRFEVRRISVFELSQGWLYLPGCRKNEWVAKMFHVKHFRHLFVVKSCILDVDDLRRTPLRGRKRSSPRDRRAQ